MNTPLENVIAKRFGILPNFFRLASSDPQIAANLWGFAQFAYLDNPLPSLFKERLFVYLSRFCEVRYCIARHVGFLAGLGHAAGDSSCLPQSVESILPCCGGPSRAEMACSHFSQSALSSIVPSPRFLSQTAPENRRSSRARHTFSFRLPMHRRRTRRCGARSDRST